MLSTVPAFSFSEPGLVNQFLDFQTGFTPWDCSDFFSVDQFSLDSDTGSGYHDMKTGSDESCPGLVKTKIDEPDSNDPKHTNFDSGEQNHNRDKLNRPEITEERKRKRMESNRESARRSRMRKQSHIDNLRNQVNRLDLENRELKNQLRLVLYHLQRVNTDNNRLLTEQEILRLKLSEMRRILIIRQQLQEQQQQWEVLHNRRMIMN